MQNKGQPSIGVRAAALLAFVAAPAALHAQSNLTSPSALAHALHILYIAAAIMAVVLLIVLAVAYLAARKAGQEELVRDDSDDSTR